MIDDDTSAHPCAGGENRRPLLRVVLGQGSSLRGRGKRSVEQTLDIGRGLIPARAGKTFRLPPPRRGAEAHPCAGGENAAMRRTRRTLRGSSLRGRGKPETRRTGATSIRLIPARAGKTAGACRTWLPLGAHPCAGGENHHDCDCEIVPAGSSLRGRGKPGYSPLFRRRQGLIPARAGKTLRGMERHQVIEAHPCAGGENALGSVLHGLVGGSSLRGRGKLGAPPTQLRRSRLIPARAGKTLSDLRFYRADRSDLGNP